MAVPSEQDQGQQAPEPSVPVRRSRRAVLPLLAVIPFAGLLAACEAPKPAPRPLSTAEAPTASPAATAVATPSVEAAPTAVPATPTIRPTSEPLPSGLVIPEFNERGGDQLLEATSYWQAEADGKAGKIGPAAVIAEAQKLVISRSLYLHDATGIEVLNGSEIKIKDEIYDIRNLADLMLVGGLTNAALRTTLPKRYANVFTFSPVDLMTKVAKLKGKFEVAESVSPLANVNGLAYISQAKELLAGKDFPKTLRPVNNNGSAKYDAASGILDFNIDDPLVALAVFYGATDQNLARNYQQKVREAREKGVITAEALTSIGTYKAAAGRLEPLSRPESNDDFARTFPMVLWSGEDIEGRILYAKEIGKTVESQILRAKFEAIKDWMDGVSSTYLGTRRQAVDLKAGQTYQIFDPDDWQKSGIFLKPTPERTDIDQRWPYVETDDKVQLLDGRGIMPKDGDKYASPMLEVRKLVSRGISEERGYIQSVYVINLKGR